MEWLTLFGVPVAITGLFFEILKWKLKRMLNEQEENRKKEEAEREKREAEREARELEREKGRERLIMLQLQSSRAAVVLSEATARAVQRIPQAQCNGDMTRALAEAAKIQGLSKDFLFEQGIHALYERAEE